MKRAPGTPVPRSCATCGHLERSVTRAPSGGLCDFEGETVACSPSGVCGRWAGTEEEEEDEDG